MNEPDPPFSRKDGILLGILGLQNPDMDGVEAAWLWRQAQVQRVLPFVAWHVREHASDAWSLPLLTTARAVRYAALAGNMKLLALLERIQKAFDQAGLEWIALKGPVFTARCFGDLARRTSFDLDVMVRPEDAHKAHRLLREVNICPDGKAFSLKKRPFGLTTHEHKYYSAESGTLIELHVSLADERYRIVPTEQAFRRKTSFAIEQRSFPVLSPEDTLMHYGLHGFGHRWDRLNHVLNVACIMRMNGIPWDWDYILATARASRKLRPLLWGLALARDLLNVALPSTIAALIEQDKTLVGLCQRTLPNFTSHVNRSASPLQCLLEKLHSLESTGDRVSLIAQACRKAIHGKF